MRAFAFPLPVTGSHYDEFKELKVLAPTQPHMMARIREIICGHNFNGKNGQEEFSWGSAQVPGKLSPEYCREYLWKCADSTAKVTLKLNILQQWEIFIYFVYWLIDFLVFRTQLNTIMKQYIKLLQEKQLVMYTLMWDSTWNFHNDTTSYSQILPSTQITSASGPEFIS